MAIENVSGTRAVGSDAEVCVLVWQTHASLFNDSV
jgi:hypothetical protein